MVVSWWFSWWFRVCLIIGMQMIGFHRICVYLVVHPTDRKWVISYNPSYMWTLPPLIPSIIRVVGPTYDSWDEPPSIYIYIDIHVGLHGIYDRIYHGISWEYIGAAENEPQWWQFHSWHPVA